MDLDEAGPSSVLPSLPGQSTPNTAKSAKKVKKHATVYQKNALYGAYRFWRKKNEDLKARGVDVGFEWKELFDFFGFAKTTGFKVIKDAEADPSTLLRKDETGRVETRGRKPKMSEDQIEAVEKMLEGQDPFQEGIEWKVIAKQLDLDVHKHTVRRTIRRNLQSRRKPPVATPSRPAPATPAIATPMTSTPIPLQAQAPAPLAPSMQRPIHEVNINIVASQPSPLPTVLPHNPHNPPSMVAVPTNLDPRIMAMSAHHQHTHPLGPHRPPYSEVEMAHLLTNAP